MLMVASFCWYLGLLGVAIGMLCLLRPMKRLGLGTRRRALAALFVGIGLASATIVTGTGTKHVPAPVTLLDQVFPVFQFNEQHAIEIAASSERTYRAMLEVTPEEIAGYRTLTRIRCLGRCSAKAS